MKNYYSKKSNKKGFTLIELLAVLVVLAILALITTPIVLGIINDARKSARQRSVDAYGKAIELGVAQIMIDQESAGDVPDESKPYVPGESSENGALGRKYETGLTSTIMKYAQGANDRGTKYVTTKGSKVTCDVFEIYADGSIYLTKCKVDDKYDVVVDSGDPNGYEESGTTYYVYKSEANTAN